MRKAVLGSVLAVLLLIAFMLVKTLTFTSMQVKVEPAASIKLDAQEATSNLARAIQFRTISHPDPAKSDPVEFKSFHQFLQETFPKLHNTLTKEVINDFGLLYTWKGTDSNLKPAVFMAHMDVVPIATGTEDDWLYPPFAGRITEGFIWGRGSLDDKVSLMGIMEAVEALLLDGYRPRRTIFLAFGHDEEVGGQRGAFQIAKLLESRGVKSEYILDESGVIITGALPGISSPVALIGLAEKGYLTLKLTVEREGGHSSMPPKQSAIGILASAIHNLESNQFPAELEGPMMQMFDYVGPEMRFGMKFLIANRWLFGGLLESELKKSNSIYATLHTTTAVTVIRAGKSENVLPQRAEAIVNFRLLPGDSIEFVIEHVKRATGDHRVAVSFSSEFSSEASKISDVNSEGFKILERTIREVFPDCVVAPYLVPAATDARYYGEISDNILRFLPTRLKAGDLKRFHGTNERVGVENYKEIVEFYIQMIRNSN